MKYTITAPPSSTPQTIDVNIPEVTPTHTISGTTPIEEPSDPNNPPVVNAGANQTIQLPLNSVTLSGSATDSDGNIVGYKWAKLSGGAANIVTPSDPKTTVTGLTEGLYTFQLAATDNDGATEYALTTITVKAAIVVPAPVGDLPNGYVEVYKNDFSKAADLNPGNHNQQGAGKLNTVNFISAPSSFESIAASASSGYRSEIQMDSSMTAVDGGMEFYINFQNYKQTSWGGHCCQYHPNGTNSNGSATVSIYFTEGKFQLMRNLGGSNMFSGTKAIESNKWYKIRLMVKWSTGTDGSIELYIDDMVNPYVTYKGRTQADNALPYAKCGQNNWGSSKGIPLLYDNFRMFKKA